MRVGPTPIGVNLGKNPCNIDAFILSSSDFYKWIPLKNLTNIMSSGRFTWSIPMLSDILLSNGQYELTKTNVTIYKDQIFPTELILKMQLISKVNIRQSLYFQILKSSFQDNISKKTMGVSS